jgi:hypothetical protein
MTPTNNKILVRVDLEQKDTIIIAGREISTARNFETNYREKSPVVAEVIEGNQILKGGDVILCHHNIIYKDSPFHLTEDLFSIPEGPTIFAKVHEDGSLRPLYGNILCEQVPKEYSIGIPPELQEKHLNRVKVIDGSSSEYEENTLLFTRPYAFYEIVYSINNNQSRVFKVHESQVCGLLRDW